MGYENVSVSKKTHDRYGIDIVTNSLSGKSSIKQWRSLGRTIRNKLFLLEGMILPSLIDKLKYNEKNCFAIFDGNKRLN